MANILYRQMPAPRQLPQQIPAPGKSLDAKAPGWGQVFGPNPQGCAGGWLWMKMIPALLTCT